METLKHYDHEIKRFAASFAFPRHVMKAQDLSQRDFLLLGLCYAVKSIKDDPSLSIRDLTPYLPFHAQKIRRHLEELIQKGYVEKSGRGKYSLPKSRKSAFYVPNSIFLDINLSISDTARMIMLIFCYVKDYETYRAYPGNRCFASYGFSIPESFTGECELEKLGYLQKTGRKYKKIPEFHVRYVPACSANQKITSQEMDEFFASL